MAKLLSEREEVQFGRPLIRFRRIRGRIVPILNKKRAGKELGKIGSSSISLGAGIAIAGTISRQLKKANLIKATPGGRAAKAIKSRFGRVVLSPIKFATKAPVKLGLAFAAAGIVLRSVGFDLEADSEFGFDILAKKVNK